MRLLSRLRVHGHTVEAVQDFHLDLLACTKRKRRRKAISEDEDARAGQAFLSGPSPLSAVLKFRMPWPKPFASSGIFLPPKSSTATPRMTSSSGKPSDGICL